MKDIAFDARRRRWANVQAPRPTDDSAIYNHIIGNHLALDRGAFAHRQQMRAYIALNRAFHLKVARGFHVSGNVQIK